MSTITPQNKTTSTVSPEIEETRKRLECEKVDNKIKRYLDKNSQSDTPGPFYLFLQSKPKESNVLYYNPTRTQRKKFANLQEEFKKGLIAGGLLSEKAKEYIQSLPRSFLYRIDEHIEIAQGLSLEKAFQGKKSPWIILQILKSENPPKELFGKLMAQVSDKAIQVKLLNGLVADPKLLPYLEELQEKHFSLIYKLIRYSRAEILNAPAVEVSHPIYPPETFQAPLKRFIKRCFRWINPPYMQGSFVDLRDVFVKEELDCLQKDLENFPKPLLECLVSIGAVTGGSEGKKLEIRKRLIPAESLASFYAALKKIQEITGEEKSILSSGLSSEQINTVYSKKEEFAFESIDSKVDCILLRMNSLVELACKKGMLVWNEDLRRAYYQIDVEVFEALLTKNGVDDEEKDKATKEYKENLYNSTRVEEESCKLDRLSIKSQSDSIQTKFSGLYTTLKSQIQDELFSALLDKAYASRDYKYLKQICDDLANGLIPSHSKCINETKEASSLDSIQQMILDNKPEKSIVSLFVKSVLGIKRNYAFSDIQKEYNAKLEFINQRDAEGNFLTNPLRDFFKSKGLVLEKPEGGYRFSSGSSLLVLRLIKGYERYFLSQLANVAIQKKVKVKLEEHWSPSEMNSLYKDLKIQSLESLKGPDPMDPICNIWESTGRLNNLFLNIFKSFAPRSIQLKPNKDEEKQYIDNYLCLCMAVDTLKEVIHHSYNANVQNKCNQVDLFLDSLNLEALYKKTLEMVSDLSQNLNSEVSDAILFATGIGFKLTSDKKSVTLFKGEKLFLRWIQSKPFYFGMMSDDSQLMTQDLFYMHCCHEIERLNMPRVYKELTERAVFYQNTEVLDWIFDQIALERCANILENSSDFDVPEIRHLSLLDASSVIKVSHINEDLKNEALASLEHFSAIERDLSKKIDSENEEEKSEYEEARKEIINYIKHPKYASKPFARFLQRKGFSPSSCGLKEMQEFDRLFRDFQAIQASELRRRGVFGVELLIDDIKHFGFTEFKFFDIEPFKEVTTARSALEVGFKNSFGIYVRHLLRNTTLTTEEFKEFYSSLYPDEKLRLVTDALLSAATSKSRQYTQFLFESEDPKDQEILFEALSKMHVSHNVDLSVVIRLVGEGLFKSKKAIDRVLNESKIAEKYLEAASTLLNESKSSSGEESKVSAAPAQAKIPFLKGFYENYLGFGGVDPTTGGGYFSFDSLFNMQRAVARGIRYLKILFAIEGESEDFSRIDVLIQVQIKKMIREYYLKMGETDVKKHPQWRIGKETYAEFLQRLPEDLQNTLSESVLAQKSCFPWKGIENTHSLLGQYIQKSKMNSLNPIDPFRQWLDFVDLSQYLILEIETKFLVLEQYFESLPLNSKEKKFMFDLLKEIAVYLSQAKMMPHNGDIVAKLVELHVSAQEKVQRIDKNTIWKNLVEKRENSATSYFKWLKSSPEIGIEVFGENEMSIYQKHSTMRLCKEQTFQLLNTLLTELNEKKRNVYQRLLPIFHQEGKEPFKRWLAQTILYEKYLREINKPDSPHKELLSLADMLDKEPVSVKIEKTRLHLVSSYKYDELNKGLSKIELFKYYDKK